MSAVIPAKLFRSPRPGYSGGERTPVSMGQLQHWIEAAQALGIASVICLLDEEHLRLYPDSSLIQIYTMAGFAVRHIPAVDHCHPPLTADQLSAVLSAYRKLSKPVLIHSSAGLGRTGFAVEHILEHESR